nr:hypothetical protein CFP56_18634 [Quercus suber]
MVCPSRDSRVHLLHVVGSDFEWASLEKSNILPTVGLSWRTKLAQPGLGITQLIEAIFFSPSSLVMGESSATTAEASLDIPMSLMLTKEVADCQVVSLTSSNSLMVGWTEVGSSFLDGFIFDDLVVP